MLAKSVGLAAAIQAQNVASLLLLLSQAALPLLFPFGLPVSASPAATTTLVDLKITNTSQKQQQSPTSSPR